MEEREKDVARNIIEFIKSHLDPINDAYDLENLTYVSSTPNLDADNITMKRHISYPSDSFWFYKYKSIDVLHVYIEDHYNRNIVFKYLENKMLESQKDCPLSMIYIDDLKRIMKLTKVKKPSPLINVDEYDKIIYPLKVNREIIESFHKDENDEKIYRCFYSAKYHSVIYYIKDEKDREFVNNYFSI